MGLWEISWGNPVQFLVKNLPENKAGSTDILLAGAEERERPRSWTPSALDIPRLAHQSNIGSLQWCHLWLIYL